jgi:ParB family chromosome partitioning protein
MRKLGAQTVVALLVPDPEVAFKILALNTEKAHNLKEKSLETIRMERALAERMADRTEQSFAFEFDQPAFLTLGAAYEKRPRRVAARARRSAAVDDFLDSRSRSAQERGRGRKILKLDDHVSAAVEKRRPRSLPRVRVARVNRASQTGVRLTGARQDHRQRREVQRRSDQAEDVAKVGSGAGGGVDAKGQGGKGQGLRAKGQGPRAKGQGQIAKGARLISEGQAENFLERP